MKPFRLSNRIWFMRVLISSAAIWAVTFSTAGNFFVWTSCVQGPKRPVRSPTFRLPSDTELLDDLVILTDIGSLEIIEELSPSRDHLKQAATRVVVLLVDLEVLRKLVYALRKQSDLYVRRTRIGIVTLVIGNYLFF